MSIEFIKKGFNMTLKLNDKTLMISGYKGDTAYFTFQFNEDISTSTVYFYVKKMSMIQKIKLF